MFFKKNYRVLVLSFLVAIVLISFSLVFQKAQANNISFNMRTSISETYSCGGYFDIPAVVCNDGVSNYNSVCKVIFPNGNVKKNATKIKLSECGKYTLRYESVIDGVNYFKDYFFTVKNDMASLFSYGEGVTVTNNQSVPNYFGQNDGVVHSSYSEDGLFWSSEEKGVKISIPSSANDTIVKYNNVINLNKLGFSNNSFGYTSLYSEEYVPFLEMLFTPKYAGSLEVDKFEVVLTDVYDESNYITIEFTPDRYGKYNTNVKVSAKNMYDPIATFIDGGIQEWSCGTTGTYVGSSMYGVDGQYNTNSISLYFDHIDNDLNVFPIGTALWPLMKSFSDPMVVGYENVWNGFTTGEVYLSFKPTGFRSTDMSFMVFNIGGQTVNDNYNLISPVEFCVDTNGFDVKNDYILSGENRYFKVFDTVAYSSQVGLLDTNYKVFYGDEKQENILVENGKFAVEKEGVYTIEYIVDSSLCYAAKEVYIYAKNSVYDNNALDFSFNDNYLDVIKMGDRVYLYEPNITGGVGKTNIEYYVFRDGVEVELDYESRPYSFVVEMLGKYDINIVISDIAGNSISKIKSIVCSESSFPEIILPTLPEVFIKGHSYDLKDATCPQAVSSKILINGQVFDNREYFVPTGDFTLQYEMVFPNGSRFSDVFVIKVIDELPNGNYIETYFYSDINSLSTDIDKTGVYLCLTGEESLGEFLYLNKINEKFININFSFVENLDNFTKVSFELIDAINSSRKVVLSYEKISKNGREFVVFAINDEKKVNLSGPTGIQFNPNLGFVFDVANNSIKDSAGRFLAEILYYQSGEKFKDFSNDVYLKIVFEDVKAESKLLISRLASQIFTSTTTADNAGPQIVFTTEIAPYVNCFVGEMIEVPAAIGYDSFNLANDVYLKVVAPDSTVLYDGIAKESFNLRCTSAGVYNLIYKVTDSSINNNRTSKTIYVSVVDNSDLIVTVLSHETVIKVSKEYTLAELNIQTTKNYTVTTFVMDSSERKFSVQDGKFVFTETGVYEVCYLVLDENLNYYYATYKVEVVK